VSEGNLANLVAEIRQGLGETSRKPRSIRTVHRVGYAFQAAVTETAAEVEFPSPIRCQLAGAYGVFDLAPGENLIGRGADCRVALAERSVSRRHARITVGEAVTIEDLKSRNGTFVDGQVVTGPVALAHEMQVRVGSVGFVFRLVEPDALTAPLT
jgi:hypothetical protein